MAAYYFMTEEQWEKEKTYNLTDDQFLILNQIEYKESKRKAESLLRFLKKSIMLGDGSWTISFTKFHKFYNDWVNKHKKKRPSLKNISLTQLKFTVNRLRDLGLLIIEKNKKTNIYKLPATENPTNNENSKPVENTCFEGEKSKKITPMLSSSLLDIDSNGNSKKDFDSNKYEKCTSLVDVRNKVRELLKFKRVKSNWIKDKVLIAITKNFRNITKQFLESYILKTIDNFRKTYYKNWAKYTRKQSVHANFTQREDYNWVELEEQLLSHY
ncbi:plasmid replication protein [Clostridium perfringens]|uniref:plasmid replication protein n=1 Tax=Clostridium perfringens TaxID=1502 RepID=UPI0024BCDF19|nr:plasmid replication protein [Clostridium perfringens]